MVCESIRRRRRLQPAETEFLIRIFEQYPRPNSIMREMLAQKLDMSPRGVQIWFQNRRAKVKRDLVESGKAMLLFAPTYLPVGMYGVEQMGGPTSSEVSSPDTLEDLLLEGISQSEMMNPSISPMQSDQQQAEPSRHQEQPKLIPPEELELLMHDMLCKVPLSHGTSYSCESDFLNL